MVLWQTKLIASRRARWVIIGWQLFALLLLLFSPWYQAFYLLKPLLMVAVVWEGHRASRRLAQRVGVLAFDDQEGWYWHNSEWRLKSPLYWLAGAVLIDWQSDNQRQRFWLMRDAMPEKAWRSLRFYWLKGRNRQWK